LAGAEKKKGYGLKKMLSIGGEIQRKGRESKTTLKNGIKNL
jgi:hypothetical protein